MVRETFEGQLAKLKDKLVYMSQRVDAAIDQALQSLINQDTALADKVISEDEQINQIQRELEEESLTLIATQQPMASDLRTILAVSHIAYELERIGDHAEGIARIARRLAGQPPLKPYIDIPRMAAIGRELLQKQIKAFMAGDEAAARQLGRRDEEVDNLYDQVFRELLVFMMDDPRTITRATYLLWVAHNLERIADRTTNIGERVVFVTRGSIEELNPRRPDRER